MSKPKNPAAVEMGKLSRKNPSEAQKAASRLNGQKGGRPPQDKPKALPAPSKRQQKATSKNSTTPDKTTP